MWVHEGGQAKEQSSHPSLWLECHTPLSSFPSPIFFFFDMHSAYVFLPAVKFCTLPQCGSPRLCFRAPFGAG